MKKIMLNSSSLKEFLKNGKAELVRTGLLGLTVIAIGSFAGCNNNNKETEDLPSQTDTIEIGIGDEIIVDDVEIVDVDEIIKDVVTPTPVVTETPIVTETPVVTETPIVTETPVITETPVVSETLKPTQAPTEKPVVTETPKVTQTPADKLVVTETPSEDMKKGSVTYQQIIDRADLVYKDFQKNNYADDVYASYDTAISLVTLANYDYIDYDTMREIVKAGHVSSISSMFSEVNCFSDY